MSHMWMSHVAHMNESVAHMNESCHSYEWVMSHRNAWNIRVIGPCNCRDYSPRPHWFLCVTWLIHMCNMTQSHLSFWMPLDVPLIRETWLIHRCDMTVWHMTYWYMTCGMCVTWLIATWRIHTRDVIWCICAALLLSIHTCDMTHSYVRHDLFIRETWFFHTWDMTRS